MFVCLCELKDLATQRTDMALLYSEASHRSRRVLKLFWGEGTANLPRNIIPRKIKYQNFIFYLKLKW